MQSTWSTQKSPLSLLYSKLLCLLELSRQTTTISTIAAISKINTSLSQILLQMSTTKLHLLHYDVFESDTDDNRQSKQIKSKSKRARKRRTKPAETSKAIKLGTSSNNKEKARRAKKPEARAVAVDVRAKEPLISGTTRSNAPLSADLPRTKPLISGTYLENIAFYCNNFSFHEDDMPSCYFSDWQTGAEQG